MCYDKVTESEKSATEARRSFQRKLARHFERRLATTDAARINAAVAQLSNEAVSLCSAAMAESWAMRRLAERYTTAEQESLSPADRERLDRMVNTHGQRAGAHPATENPAHAGVD